MRTTIAAAAIAVAALAPGIDASHVYRNSTIVATVATASYGPPPTKINTTRARITSEQDKQPRKPAMSTSTLHYPASTMPRSRHYATKSTGCSVNPAQFTPRNQQEPRKDSAIDPATVREDIRQALPKQTRKSASSWDAGGISTFERQPRVKDGIHNLILCFILFIACFGGAYVLLDYLLSATRTLAQCTPSTIYIPVTETETTTTTRWLPTTATVTVTRKEFFSASSQAKAASLPENPPATSTVTVQRTQIVTVNPSPAPAKNDTSLRFIVTDGTTRWLGATPSSGATIVVTGTETIYVTPQPVTVMVSVPASTAGAQDSTTHVTSNSTSTIFETTTVTATPSESFGSISQDTLTVVAPAYTSTHYRLMSPDSTTTLTSTRYVTIPLSAVSHSPDTSRRPSAFSGVNSKGWNASTTEALTSPMPITTTLTEIAYHGTGRSTASTTTIYLTTTVGATLTQTVTPPASFSTVNGSLTIIAPTPTVFTYVVGATGLSTSITFGEKPSLVSSLSTLAAGKSKSEALTANTPPTFAFSYPSSATPSATLASQPASSLSVGTTPFATSHKPPFSNSSSSALLQSASTSIMTVTSFVDGHGTTFTVETIISPTHSSSVSKSTESGFASSYPASGLVTSSPTVTLMSQLASTEFSGMQATDPNFAGTSSIQTVSEPESARVTTVTLSAAEISSNVGTKAPARSETFQSSSQGRQTGADPATHRSPTYESGSPTATLPSTLATVTVQSSSLISSGSIKTSRPSTLTSTSASTAGPYQSTSNSCGQQGNFTMTFDDLPAFHPARPENSKRQASWNQTDSPNSTDITQYPPITFTTRPYKHMWFSDGYVYAPHAAEPFSPISSPNIAAFVNPMKTGGRPTGKNNIEPGELGTAINDDNSTFWFDVFSAYVGCDNPGPNVCTFEATSYVWNSKMDDEVPEHVQNYAIAPCPGDNCALQLVHFPPTFRSLSGIQFRAVVGDQPRMFFVDNMAMGWSNKSCAAGNARSNSPTTGCTNMYC